MLLRHTNIKPWIVVPCDDLDCFSTLDIKLFLTKEAADKYANDVCDEHEFQFCHIAQMEVN